LSAIDTDEFRTLLEAERGRLTKAAESLQDEGTIEEELGEVGSGGTDNHLGDTASTTYERELDEGLAEGVQQTLDEIEAALKRIDDGTYGICEVCDKPIGVERLRAIPWTRYCIDDQRRRIG
jgi:DnaK suppressor protein